MAETQEQTGGSPLLLAKRALFIAAAAACASPLASPPIALFAGIALALLGWTAFDALAKRFSKIIIQVCVVLLGFRMDLSTLVGKAAEGLIFAAATIIGAMGLGLLLGKWLKTERETSLLISSGTAICGGSAIAAVGSAIRANASQMAVATGAVFILNAIALYVFPPLGHALGLTATQFGTWAGVAIHDIASVVGAAKSYGKPLPGVEIAGGAETSGIALDTANVVKLTRVLWILPIAMAAAWWTQREAVKAGAVKAKAPVPWFIALFLAASAARSLVPGLAEYEAPIRFIAGLGFQLALFLIGAGLSRAALKAVGWRAFVQASVLWIVLAAASLAAVMMFVE